MKFDSHHIAILDTNILVKSPLLTGREWESFSANCKTWDVTLVVPEVVILETVRYVTVECQGLQEKLRSHRLGRYNLDALTHMISSSLDEIVRTYESILTARLEELGITIVPIFQFDHLDIAKRASERRAPYQPSDGKNPKDGYRDTLIWLTVLELARVNQSQTIWLVSANHHDFGPRRDKGSKDQNPDWNACPQRFHSELEEELTEFAIQDRVNYVVDLGVYELFFASQFEPVDDEELISLTSLVDFAKLEGMLRDAFTSYVLGAEIELPNKAVLGIVKEVLKIGSFSFKGGARRAGGGWTVNFSVLAAAKVAAVLRFSLPNVEESESEIHKLNYHINGVVHFDASGEPTRVAISSVENGLRIGLEQLRSIAGADPVTVAQVMAILSDNLVFFDFDASDLANFLASAADTRTDQQD